MYMYVCTYIDTHARVFYHERHFARCFFSEYLADMKFVIIGFFMYYVLSLKIKPLLISWNGRI